MDNQNFFSSSFGKKTKKDKKLQKVYFQRKINTQNYPILQNKLKTFFNDYSKYFETSFDENHIIVGKKYETNQRNHSPLALSDSMNQKTKTKRLLKRPTIKRQVNSRTDSINRSRLYNDEKRKSFEENNLKPGQRFIEDKEIEKIFGLYKELRQINKNRSNNFMNIKELQEKKDAQKAKNESNFNIKSSENFFKMNSINYDIKFRHNDNVNVEDKKFKTLIMKNNSMNKNDDSQYYRTISTNVGGSEEFMKTFNNLKNFEVNKEEKQEYINNTDILKKRKQLIQKQNQYLYKNIELSLKKQFAESLALQENVFLCQNKNNKFQKHFKNFLNIHLKNKQQNSRLLIQEDNHRKNLELKMKIDFFQNKLNPDRIYDWYYDLHSWKTPFPILEKKIEIIRNPKNMKGFYNNKSKILEKDEYLKNIITSKNFKNLEKEINNVNDNYGSLVVEGKNLLQLENNIVKKIKGRKIINDYEKIMSPPKLKSENIYSNIFKKLF